MNDQAQDRYQKMLQLAEQRIDDSLKIVLGEKARILESVGRSVLDGKYSGIENLQTDLRYRKESIEEQLQQLRKEDLTSKDVTSQRVFSKGNEFSRRAEKMLSELEALRLDKDVARMYAPR